MYKTNQLKSILLKKKKLWLLKGATVELNRAAGEEKSSFNGRCVGWEIVS